MYKIYELISLNAKGMIIKGYYNFKTKEIIDTYTDDCKVDCSNSVTLRYAEAETTRLLNYLKQHDATATLFYMPAYKSTFTGELLFPEIGQQYEQLTIIKERINENYHRKHPFPKDSEYIHLVDGLSQGGKEYQKAIDDWREAFDSSEEACAIKNISQAIYSLEYNWKQDIKKLGKYLEIATHA